MVLCMSEWLFYLVYFPHGTSSKTEHIFDFCRKPSFDLKQYSLMQILLMLLWQSNCPLTAKQVSGRCHGAKPNSAVSELWLKFFRQRESSETNLFFSLVLLICLPSPHLIGDSFQVSSLELDYICLRSYNYRLAIWCWAEGLGQAVVAGTPSRRRLQDLIVVVLRQRHSRGLKVCRERAGEWQFLRFGWF